MNLLFRNQEKQNADRAQQLKKLQKDLEEANNDAKELVNLVRTKDKVIDFASQTGNALPKTTSAPSFNHVEHVVQGQIIPLKYDDRFCD